MSVILPFILLLQSGIGGLLYSLLPMFAIFAVFYFLIILPQKKRQSALQQMIAALKPGDKIITTGGVLATITAVRETSLIVRSADKSILEISRSAVAGLQGEEEVK
jgi:preprotein translocase subunit YajC